MGISQGLSQDLNQGRDQALSGLSQVLHQGVLTRQKDAPIRDLALGDNHAFLKPKPLPRQQQEEHQQAEHSSQPSQPSNVVPSRPPPNSFQQFVESEM